MVSGAWTMDAGGCLIGPSLLYRNCWSTLRESIGRDDVIFVDSSARPISVIWSTTHSPQVELGRQHESSLRKDIKKKRVSPKAIACPTVRDISKKFEKAFAILKSRIQLSLILQF